MNRTTLVFASVLAAFASAYAVDLNNVNLVGGTGEPGTNISSVATLNISNSSLTGGDADQTVTATPVTKNGGNGIDIGNVALIDIANSTLNGGDGGAIDTPLEARVDARGGHGMSLSGDFALNSLEDGIVMTGGNGGTIENDAGRAKSFGGDGFHWEAGDSSGSTDTTPEQLVFNGGIYQGGMGGSAVYSSVAVDAIYNSTYLDIGGARGGHGVRITRLDQFPVGTTVAINGGTYIGGNGGTAVNNLAGTVSAQGGSGLFVDYADVVISGGTFTGGSAGTVNGVKGVAGAGVHAQDSNITITGGNFGGDIGLRFEAHYYDVAANISGGSFSDLEFIAHFDEYTEEDLGGDGSLRTNHVNISGGSFSDVTFKGETHNNISITDGSFNDLIFSGSSINTISLLSTVTTSGKVVQEGGMTTFNGWSGSHIKDVVVAEGTMNFNNQMFNLDGMFALQSTNAAANFNNGLTVKNGGTLNLGMGTVGGSSVVTENGSLINATVTSVAGGKGNNGKIASTGNLTIGSGTEWTIDVGGSAVPVGTTFDIATASGTLTSGITEKDVDFVGSGGAAGWVGGISSLATIGTTTKTLQATYGESAIDVALGVSGDTSTEFGKAMADLSVLLAPGTAGYNQIKTLANSADAGEKLMNNGYLRTTEMASTLMGLQSVFADQIKDRTRSNLHYAQVGYPAAAMPEGAGGWEAMRDFSDRVENGFGWEGMRNFSDRTENAFGYDEIKGAVDSAVPNVSARKPELSANYQVWGRGYGSDIEQKTTDGFAGYDATIGGGMLGVDKRINNMLLGIGGGYARTTVEGYEGKDGESDTGYGVAYFAAHGRNAYLDANVNYAFNSVETDFKQMGYEGDYDAHTVGLYLGGGYGIALAKSVLLTPEVSILSSYYSRDAYTETSTIYPDLAWDSYDQWSHLGTLGATLSMIQRIDIANYEMGFRPELRAHWLHEFNAEMDNETYTMVGGVNTVGASLLAREEDLVKVGAGIRFSNWASDTTEIGVDIDGTFGDDYTAYIISGKIMHRF